MVELIIWSFVFLTIWFLIASSGKYDTFDRRRPSGAVLLTVSGKISHPNRRYADNTSDTLFKKKDFLFPSSVEYGYDDLCGFSQKRVRFLCSGETVVFEGPELRDVVADAACRYDFAAVHGGTKSLPLWRPAIESETWVLAVRRNGRGLPSGELGPILLVNHPGGDAVVTEDRAKWVSGVYYIEAK